MEAPNRLTVERKILFSQLVIVASYTYNKSVLIFLIIFQVGEIGKQIIFPIEQKSHTQAYLIARRKVIQFSIPQWVYQFISIISAGDD